MECRPEETNPFHAEDDRFEIITDEQHHSTPETPTKVPPPLLGGDSSPTVEESSREAADTVSIGSGGTVSRRRKLANKVSERFTATWKQMGSSKVGRKLSKLSPQHETAIDDEGREGEEGSSKPDHGEQPKLVSVRVIDTSLSFNTA